jgi:hypothetical protein
MKSLSRVAAPRPLSDGSPALAVREGVTPAIRPLLRPAIVATTIGLVVFLLIQGILAAYNVHVIRDAFSRGQLNGYPSNYSSLPIRLLTTLVLGSITYLVFALSGLAIASRGHRLLFMLPAVGFVLVAVVGTGYGHQPQALGTQWQIQCFRDVCIPWFAHPWLGPLVVVWRSSSSRDGSSPFGFGVVGGPVSPTRPRSPRSS